jgi:hypothetical protein
MLARPSGLSEDSRNSTSERINDMRYSATVIGATLSALLVCLPLTGCTVSQAKVNTAVEDIANWSPVVAGDATALLTDIASFAPADAQALQSFVATLNTDSAQLTVLCKQYLALPSPTLLTQIAAMIGALASSDSSALLQLLQIKDPVSQSIAKGVLTTIATAVTILSGYAAATGVGPKPLATAALIQLRPYVDDAVVGRELALAKDQGVVPQWVTLQTIGL